MRRTARSQAPCSRWPGLPTELISDRSAIGAAPAGVELLAAHGRAGRAARARRAGGAGVRAAALRDLARRPGAPAAQPLHRQALHWAPHACPIRLPVAPETISRLSSGCCSARSPPSTHCADCAAAPPLAAADLTHARASSGPALAPALGTSYCTLGTPANKRLGSAETLARPFYNQSTNQPINLFMI